MTAVPQEKEKNKGGRPIGSSTKISKLQRISTKLNEMARDDAIPLLQKSLDGDKNVDKEQLASAKFVITAAKQYHQAILAEKENFVKKDSDDKDDTPEVEETSGGAILSLKLVGGN